MSAEPARMTDEALARCAALTERPERWTVSRFAEALAEVVAECRRAREAERLAWAALGEPAEACAAEACAAEEERS